MPTLANDTALRRVTLGFSGGLTVTRRLTGADLDGLRSALDGDGAWHELKTDQELIMVSLARLAYIELDERGRPVGFG